MYDILLTLGTEDDYRSFFLREYCNNGIITHDGIKVKFYPEDFDHAFFKSSSRRVKDKLIFSTERAERIVWIGKILQDHSLFSYAGWDSDKKRYDSSRRVTIITDDNYLVVLRLTGKNKARFKTAYVIDNPDVAKKIRNSPVIYKPSSTKMPITAS